MNSIPKILTASGIALAIGLVAAFTSVASAQEKGATKLLTPKASPASSQSAGMSCSQCKDTMQTVTERPTKTGAKADTYTVARHECLGCKDTLKVVGHGKAASSMTKHTCSLSGTEGAACCAKN